MIIGAHEARKGDLLFVEAPDAEGPEDGAWKTVERVVKGKALVGLGFIGQGGTSWFEPLHGFRLRGFR